MKEKNLKVKVNKRIISLTKCDDYFGHVTYMVQTYSRYIKKFPTYKEALEEYLKDIKTEIAFMQLDEKVEQYRKSLINGVYDDIEQYSAKLDNIIFKGYTKCSNCGHRVVKDKLTETKNKGLLCESCIDYLHSNNEYIQFDWN